MGGHRTIGGLNIERAGYTPAMEHEERARGLEREVDRLEEHSEEIGQRVEDARRDWEAKKSDQGVPGAQPDQAEEERPEAEAE